MAGATLPYLASPGSVRTGLEKIRAAATPDRVTQDFITTKLQIKGGTGAALIPFFKKIGLVASDGAPTELYKRFRNPSIGGTAIAEAIQLGYAPLKQVNEYFYDLSDQDLMNLILQVTGLDHDNQVAKLTLSTLKGLKSLADFNAVPADDAVDTKQVSAIPPSTTTHINVTAPAQPKVGMNISYTINLNLPATPDQAVFNAIFKSLREHLIPDD